MFITDLKIPSLEKELCCHTCTLFLLGLSTETSTTLSVYMCAHILCLAFTESVFFIGYTLKTPPVEQHDLNINWGTIMVQFTYYVKINNLHRMQQFVTEQCDDFFSVWTWVANTCLVL